MKKIIHFHFKPKHNIGDMAVVLATRDLIEAELGKVEWSSRIFKELARKDVDAVLRDIEKHDLVLVGGGGFYSKCALPLNDQLIQAIQKPIVILGAGYNQLFGESSLSAAQIKSVRVLNQKASLCGVRDKATQDFLKDSGLESEIIGDPALFLKSELTSLVPWFSWPTRKSQPNAIKIGINLACHNWAEKVNHLERIIGVYHDVIAKLEAKFPIELYYLAHTDIKAERQLAKRLKAIWPKIIVCNKSARKLKFVYEQMNLVISMMLHSSIYAFGARVPVVNVAYDRKNLAFMALIEHPERTIDVREASAQVLHNMAEQAFYDGFSRTDEEKLQLLRQSTQNFVTKISRLI